MRKFLFLFLLVCLSFQANANPINGLLERIDKGASRKFKIEVVNTASDGKDFFELDYDKNKVIVRGNNYISIATGINWYLKYYANIHLSWNGMEASLPQILPTVPKKERHETQMLIRYYLNYCTFSYSMAFWDWEHWQKEIDWMALHGINLPLAITGAETVWYNVLKKLGYNKEEINEFVAGPAFLAWWQMNNLEGWGGPNPDEWYSQQAKLQKKILKRMREYGIEPVLPGYAGMVPRNAASKLGLNVSDPGLWCGFPRPAFLQPTDPAFESIAETYYNELTNMFGTANYYSIDPFHEGGSVEGVDLDLTGKTIMKAMKKVNPEATWVMQAWQANPRPAMVNSMEKGDLLVLDLFSESHPMWGPQWSPWYIKEGYGKHEWVFCMLLNFGARTGMHGKMEYLIKNYYNAREHQNGKTLKGVGATMEAIENNPVMFELLFELPWRNERFAKEDWLYTYTRARYGVSDPLINEAWNILANTVYACPEKSAQEGTTESVFAATPRLDVRNVSCCSTTRPFYNTDSVRLAAGKMVEVAHKFIGNNNFEYDLIDIVRQTIANKAYYLQKEVSNAYKEKNIILFDKLSKDFLCLLLAQDSLLNGRPEFMVGSWINQARKIGKNTAQRDLYEWNARTQITVWGNRASAGMLHNYAYKEWAGMLKDVYHPRWEAFFKNLRKELVGEEIEKIDFFGMDERWNKQTNSYSSAALPNPVQRACDIYYRYISK